MATSYASLEAARRQIEQAVAGDHRWLSLAGLGLDELPPALRSLTEFRALDLSGNRLTDLPAWLPELSALRVLNLSDNRFTEVPPCLRTMPGLQTLSLTGNRLVMLPDWFADLRELTELDLARNNLVEIPRELGGLALNRLDLDGNAHLIFPPQRIAAEDTEAILTYLREAGPEPIARPTMRLPRVPREPDDTPEDAPARRPDWRVRALSAATLAALVTGGVVLAAAAEHHSGGATRSSDAAHLPQRPEIPLTPYPLSAGSEQTTQGVTPSPSASASASASPSASAAARATVKQPPATVTAPAVASPAPTAHHIVSGVIHGWGGFCLDDANAMTDDNNRITIADCNGTDAQYWSVDTTDNTMHVLGKCMTVEGGSAQSGTYVVLYECGQATEQTWLRRTDGTLYNPQSGKCLDDPQSAPASRTDLDIAGCTGNANQQWSSVS